MGSMAWGRSLAWGLFFAALLLSWFVIFNRAANDFRVRFETDARIAHRLLSQRVVELDAIAQTLMISGWTPAPEGLEYLRQSYPQIETIEFRAQDQSWPDGVRQQAEILAREHRSPAAGWGNIGETSGGIFPPGYWLVSNPGTHGTALALKIRLDRLRPEQDWPKSSAAFFLSFQGQRYELQQAKGREVMGIPFRFSKPLAAPGQGFLLEAEQVLPFTQWPWWQLGAATLLWLLLAAAARSLWQQYRARQRAEGLLHLGQVARLNTYGELAAGVAHELNQPLTAILANCQAAERLIAEISSDAQAFPDTWDESRPLLQQALAQSVAQAKRGADVILRLRKAIARPLGHEAGEKTGRQALDVPIRTVLNLLAPDFRQQGIHVLRSGESSDGLFVAADGVGLEIILHNLLQNAAQALQRLPLEQSRQIEINVTRDGPQVAIRIIDNGPGLSPETLDKLFTPFYSTRPDGLGLGLTLCESLARNQGGALTAGNCSQGGAVFCLSLPMAHGAGLPVSTAITSAPLEKKQP